MTFVTHIQTNHAIAQQHPAIAKGIIPIFAKPFAQSFKPAITHKLLAVGLGLVGMATLFTPAPAQAANLADIAQLTETGICKDCDLSGADLTGEHLIGADLRGANLTGTILAHANLEGADLTGATLINTDLSYAYLTNAVLDEATIAQVDFSEATLIYTSLNHTHIEDVVLVGADVISTPISVGGSYDQ